MLDQRIAGTPEDREAPPVAPSRATAHRQVANLILASGGTVASFAVAAVAVAWLYVGHVPDVGLGIWCAATLAALAFDGLVIATFRRSSDAERERARWRWLLLAGALATGAAWMASLVWFGRGAPPEVERAHLLLYAACVAMVAGGSPLHLGAYRAIMPILVLPAFAYLLLLDPRVGVPSALALAALVRGLHYYITLHHDNSQRLLVSEASNAALADELAARMLEVEASLADARAASQEKSRFIAAASHDLRQPLHAMTLFLDAVRHHNSQPRLTPMLERMGEANAALSALMAGLLDLSRLEAGVVDVHPEPFPLEPLLERLLEGYGPDAEAKGLSLDVVLDDGWTGAPVHTDRVLLEQILRNLLSNAIRYTDTGGVRIELAPAGPDVLTVALVDSGIGMGPDELERAFDDYVQIGAQRGQHDNGLGLGLSIVRRLSTLLALELDVDSAPGIGSRFTLKVPLARADAISRAADPPATREVVIPPGLGVLLVDDNADVRDGMRAMLESVGCAVRATDCAENVMAMLAEAPADVVIADHHLGAGMSGAQLLERLGAAHPAVRGVLITADVSNETLRGRRSPSRPVLYKPVSVAALKRVLAEGRPRGGPEPTERPGIPT